MMEVSKQDHTAQHPVIMETEHDVIGVVLT